MTIYNDISAELANRNLHLKHRVIDLSLSNYFTVVMLDDQSIGACMSYYSLDQKALKRSERDYLSLSKNAPLSLAKREEPLDSSIKWSILSALSQPLLSALNNEDFIASDVLMKSPFINAEKCVVIGFGGYINKCVEAEEVKELSIFDLTYNTRQSEMNSWVQIARKKAPNKCIKINPPEGVQTMIGNADACFITGSSLVNGTLEQLLSFASESTYVVVQGQSASVIPQALFNRGVNMVQTTIKPKKLMRLAHQGQSHILLENSSLPNIFLYPNPK